MRPRHRLLYLLRRLLDAIILYGSAAIVVLGVAYLAALRWLLVIFPE